MDYQKTSVGIPRTFCVASIVTPYISRKIWKLVIEVVFVHSKAVQHRVLSVEEIFRKIASSVDFSVIYHTDAARFLTYIR